MATLYVMIGIPGSGKSTYAKNISNTVVVNSEDIRFELTNDYSDMSRNAEVFDILEERLETLLKDNKNAVYDATNTNKYKRRRVTERFKDLASEIVYIFMDTPLSIAIERNEKRERKTPESVIESMYEYMSIPTIVTDNYDKLITVKPDGNEVIKNGIKG